MRKQTVDEQFDQISSQHTMVQIASEQLLYCCTFSLLLLKSRYSWFKKCDSELAQQNFMDN